MNIGDICEDVKIPTSDFIEICGLESLIFLIFAFENFLTILVPFKLKFVILKDEIKRFLDLDIDLSFHGEIYNYDLNIYHNILYLHTAQGLVQIFYGRRDSLENKKYFLIVKNSNILTFKFDITSNRMFYISGSKIVQINMFNYQTIKLKTLSHNVDYFNIFSRLK